MANAACAAAAAVFAALLSALPASAAVLVQINKTTQQMTVSVNGEPRYVWPVSTGRAGYATPSGSFKAFRMEAEHFSKEWDDAPMPHSIFFTSIGHAIHGTYETRYLGSPVSHGCVRLSPSNAKILFDLVKREGLLETRVVLTGQAPARAPLVAQRGQPAVYGAATGPLDLSPKPYSLPPGQFNESGAVGPTYSAPPPFPFPFGQRR